MTGCKHLVLYTRLEPFFPCLALLLDGEGNLLAELGLSHSAEELSRATDLACDRSTLILTGDQCVSRCLDLKVRSAKQFLAAARYAVEDELATAPDALHLAFVESDAGGRRVGFIEEERLRDGLAIVREAGLKLDAVIADYELLPPGTALELTGPFGPWTLVRQADGSGFSGEPDFVEAVLQSGAMRGDAMPQASGMAISVADLVRDPLSQGGQQERHLLSLLQGAFSSRPDYMAVWRVWRPATIALASLVLVAALSLGFDIAQTWASAKALEKEAMARFSEAFPGEEAPRSLAQVTLLGTPEDKGPDFLGLMAALTRGVEAVPALRLEMVRFSRDKGEIEALAVYRSFDDVDLLKRRSADFGLEIVEGAARQEGDVILSDLKVRALS